MKKSEWERRRPLDLDGVQLLGAALYLRAKWLRDLAGEQLRSREEAELAGPINEFEWLYELKFYQDQLASEEAKCKDLDEKLCALDTPKSVFVRAKSLRAKDFQFRWDHLKSHPNLVGYISDDQPRFAQGWDRATAISKRWGDDLTSALGDIFKREFHRLDAGNHDLTPDLSEREDLWFYLSVWRLCEPDNGRGQPSGRRWSDGLEEAASYAYYLLLDAVDAGVPMSNDEAIRRSLDEFSVIGSREFEGFQDKRSAVVSDALSEGGRLEGAIKAVRKRLVEWPNPRSQEF